MLKVAQELASMEIEYRSKPSNHWFVCLVVFQSPLLFWKEQQKNCCVPQLRSQPFQAAYLILLIHFKRVSLFKS